MVQRSGQEMKMINVILFQSFYLTQVGTRQIPAQRMRDTDSRCWKSLT
jgi:hypothetical protein